MQKPDTNLDYCKLPFTFNVTKLQAELKQIQSEEWIAHYNQADYEGDWHVAGLRSVLGDVDNIYASNIVNIFNDTPLLKRCPYIAQIIASFKCEKTAIRFMKLAPGAVIKEHADSALSIKDGEARLHIPICTNPQVEFYLNQERLPLREGECWYLDFTLLHSVKNLGDSPRVHLVMDCKLNDWLEKTLTNS